MVRTFTVNFSYRGKTYPAVISQVRTALHIYVPGESFHDVLPDGRYSFDLEAGLNRNLEKGTAMEDVVMNILCAVEKQGSLPVSIHAKPML